MNIRSGALVVAATAAVLLAGCATDRVIFVTKTSIGLDIDRTPGTLAIAYDRIDGFFGPRYDNGAVPPVVASINTDLAVFAPQIRQVYATGNAATLVTTPSPLLPQPLLLRGNRKSMFFGTSTTVGLKIGFDVTGLPESLTLGYKRKEMSVIPVGTTTVKDAAGNDVEIDTYPSVLASIDMRIKAASVADTSFGLNQFFATGNAAESLAANNAAIRRSFITLAQKALEPAAAVVVAPELQARRKKMADYVRALRTSGDKNTLGAIADAMNLPKQADIPSESAAILDEIEQRSRDAASMDQLSTLLKPITRQDF
jgi:hypothetical protein